MNTVIIIIIIIIIFTVNTYSEDCTMMIWSWDLGASLLMYRSYSTSVMLGMACRLQRHCGRGSLSTICRRPAGQSRRDGGGSWSGRDMAVPWRDNGLKL